MTRTGYPTRRGYTLVELLVVMSLMILLAALAVGVSYSGMVGSQKVISGADRASGWLLIAKQRALRDGAPRGVRFFQNAKDANSITEAQYIEQPDVWLPNPQQEGNPGGMRIVFVYQYNSTTNIVATREVYLISGSTTDLTTEYDNRVSNGDSLILPEFGASFKITNRNDTSSTTPLTLGTPFASITGTITPTTGFVPTMTAVSVPAANYRRITLSSITNQIGFPDLAAGGTPLQSSPPPGIPITMTTYKFGFQGAPQLLLGEPVLQLAGGVVIDYRLGMSFPPGGPQPDADGYRTSSTATINTPPYNPPTTIGLGGVWKNDASGNYFDIVFAPSGQVLNNANSMICLWIRGRDVEDPSDPRKFNPRLDTSGANCDLRALFNDAGEQALVVVSVKSGLINTQPVNPPPASGPTAGHDPYIFARDGLSSGL